MWKLISIIITGILTSFYFFPFEFTFLPGVNTKMAMAGVGLVLLGIQLAKRQNANFDKNIFNLSFLALLVSLAGFLAVTYNNTRDYTYVSYIISMWVWLSGAFVAVSAIRKVHGGVSVELVANYLIAVCSAQCIFALMIDQIPAFKNIVDTYVSGLGFVELDTLGKADRLYGIGAGLDVAGSRFAAVLLMIAYIVSHFNKTCTRKYIYIYLIAFLLISVVGNMIARTTTIGIALALIYWIILAFSKSSDLGMARLWKWIGGILCAFIPLIVLYYYANPSFAQNLRFAFEGFFSLAETGEWDVHSNEILKDMIVFPDNLRTWLIGDGYIENPYGLDPYYIGPNFGGYYMATDIGYLRFIFYFGLIGLSAFCYFMYRVGITCMQKFNQQKIFFVLVLSINFIVWCKVSTDIFLVFALFLCVGKEENDAYNERIAIKE